MFLGTLEPDRDPPEHVKIVPWFHLDMKELLTSTAMDSPPNIPIRESHAKVFYIVDDASDSGFRSSQWVQYGVSIDSQFGRWTFDVTENESSNFRESANLMNSLKCHLQMERFSQEQRHSYVPATQLLNPTISRDLQSHTSCTK